MSAALDLSPLLDELPGMGLLHGAVQRNFDHFQRTGEAVAIGLVYLPDPKPNALLAATAALRAGCGLDDVVARLDSHRLAISLGARVELRRKALELLAEAVCAASIAGGENGRAVVKMLHPEDRSAEEWWQNSVRWMEA